jgi:hypothetical protein
MFFGTKRNIFKNQQFYLKSAGKMAGEAIESFSEGISSFTKGLMDSLGEEE